MSLNYRVHASLIVLLTLAALSASDAVAQNAAPAPVAYVEPQSPSPCVGPDPADAQRSFYESAGLPAQPCRSHVALAEFPGQRRIAEVEARPGGALLAEYIYQFWSGSGWNNQYRVLYEYEAGLETEIVFQLGAGTEWINNSRATFTNEPGVAREAVYEAWDGSAWEVTRRGFFSYENGRLAEVSYQDLTESGWVDDDRLLYSYDAEVLVEFVYQIWDGSEWANSYREESTYDSELLVEVLAQSGSGAGWVNETRTTYSYEEGLRTEVLVQSWSGGWVNTLRVGYTFEAGLESSALQQYWDGVRWVDDIRGFYAYEDGLVTELLFQYWDVDAMEWRNDYRDLTAYAEGLITEILTQVWANSTWIDYARQQQSFVTPTTTEDVSAQPDAEVQVYPNPAVGTVSVAFTLDAPGAVRFEVYDVLGRLLFASDRVLPVGQHVERIDVGGLTAGTYFVRVRGAVNDARGVVVSR